MGLIVAILIYWEYKDHDCIKTGKCNRSVPRPKLDDDTLECFDKLRVMVKNNHDYVLWRLALLAGIIGALPIVYYIEARVPTLFEWIIVGGLIFLAAYLSSSWIWAHFFHPNSRQIEKSIINIRDKVHKIVKEYKNLTEDNSCESQESYGSLISSDGSSDYNTSSDILSDWDWTK